MSSEPDPVGGHTPFTNLSVPPSHDLLATSWKAKLAHRSRATLEADAASQPPIKAHLFVQQKLEPLSVRSARAPWAAAAMQA